ncbi:protein of unknown function [Micropruina glycogenica]|uniref:Uncharacterized protein n=1 Tax=Micropruina glycogenica TaxID=75385 RepID=A0A2N9JLQ3_9ACTN|nr:protein of unknown function [Micropruina glycogenica]
MIAVTCVTAGTWVPGVLVVRVVRVPVLTRRVCRRGLGRCRRVHRLVYVHHHSLYTPWGYIG